MNADTFIKGQLANFCIREAIGAGGIDNMIGVAHVLRNRVEAGWYGGDWMTALEEASISRGSMPANLSRLDLRKSEVKQFLQQIDDVYHGSDEDTTNGALYYAEPHNITSDWFLHNIARDPANHPLRATIGLTSFFG